MLLRLDAPQTNDKGPSAMEHALAAVGHIDGLTFEFATQDDKRGLFLRFELGHWRKWIICFLLYSMNEDTFDQYFLCVMNFY